MLHDACVSVNGSPEKTTRLSRLAQITLFTQGSVSGYGTVSLDCEARDMKPYLEPILRGLSPGTAI